jgi:hypothetical protein
VNAAEVSEAEGLSYQYRPRLIGSEAGFRLAREGLDWFVGGRSGRIAYPMVRRVRLSYRPSNLGNRRFITEIWSPNAPRMEIASASYRSVVSMDDQGPAYNAFIEQLHRRLASAGGDCRFEAGFPAWRWWPMLVVAIVAGLALCYVAIQSVGSGDFSAAVLVAGFILLFVWQVAPLVWRNRPRRYDPRTIPPEVLPSR